MPFLLDFISKIEHESTLNTFSNSQVNLRVPIPFHGIQTSIMNLHAQGGTTTTVDNVVSRGGVSPGDAIELAGISGSGKSWMMSKIATYTINQTSSHIIYIDLDDRFDQSTLIDARFHLFKSTIISDFIYSLETWLEEHADIHVLWIMLDGINIDIKYVNILRSIQKKWAFVLLTTTTKIQEKSMNDIKWDYRFLLTRNNHHSKMELLWPMHMDAFTLD